MKAYYAQLCERLNALALGEPQRMELMVEIIGVLQFAPRLKRTMSRLRTMPSFYKLLSRMEYVGDVRVRRVQHTLSPHWLT
ncbi:MAG: hypothetical protein R3F37_16895 [Candidatus Competibacteraceae bacterium]